MDKFKKRLMWVASIILIFIIVAIIINIGTLKGWITDFTPEFYERSWIAFWGSIAGGFLTITGVFITVLYMIKNADEQDELRILPHLSLNDVNIAQTKDGMQIIFHLKNIGEGTALISKIEYDGIGHEEKLDHISFLRQRYDKPELYCGLGKNEEVEIFIRTKFESSLAMSDLQGRVGLEYSSIRNVPYIAELIFQTKDNGTASANFEIIARKNERL